MGLQHRQWLQDHWSTILREIAYHKEHKEAEKTEYKVVWKREE